MATTDTIKRVKDGIDEVLNLIDSPIDIGTLDFLDSLLDGISFKDDADSDDKSEAEATIADLRDLISIIKKNAKPFNDSVETLAITCFKANEACQKLTAFTKFEKKVFADAEGWYDATSREEQHLDDLWDSVDIEKSINVNKLAQYIKESGHYNDLKDYIGKEEKEAFSQLDESAGIEMAVEWLQESIVDGLTDSEANEFLDVDVHDNDWDDWVNLYEDNFDSIKKEIEYAVKNNNGIKNKLKELASEAIKEVLGK